MKNSIRMRFGAAALLCTALLCACGGETAGEKQTDNDAVTEAVTEANPAAIFESLGVKDYEGREFNFLVRTASEKDVCPNGENGEVYNDAVVERNRLVESTYNIKIKPYLIDSTWGVHEQYMQTMRSSIMAGDGAWDLIDGYAAVVGSGYGDHIFMNLNEVEPLNLSAEWWSAVSREELTVNDRLYDMAGDISTSVWSGLNVIFFNKGILASLDLDTPYQMVKDGKWTFDAMDAMTKNVYQDLNGDNAVDSADRFGMIFADDRTLDTFRASCNVGYTKKNADGTLELDMLTDKLVELFEKTIALTYNNNDVLYKYNGETFPGADGMTKFAANEALFFAYSLGASSNMRSMETDFGILPYPKWDEAQTEYYTTSQDGRSMWLIPTDVKDVEFAGTITEALCIAGHEIIIPVYKDKILNGKNIRDTESAEMIDIVRNGLKLDIVFENGLHTNEAGFFFRYAVALNSPIVSIYEGRERNFLIGYEKFINDAYYGE